MTWTVDWPASAPTDLDPNIKALAELYATACLTALTLQRVGGGEVTIMPEASYVRGWHTLWTPLADQYPLGHFYPGEFYPSAQDLRALTTYLRRDAVDLPGPVGPVSEVRVNGVALAPSAYRVEDGRYLVRVDGGAWPSASGDGFTVTYRNAHDPGVMGRHAAGILAMEWVKLLTRAKDCRLPKTLAMVSRNGMTMEITRGMFPDGITGIAEVDAFVMLYNPFGLKVAPRVYSPDLPRHRQVTQ